MTFILPQDGSDSNDRPVVENPLQTEMRRIVENLYGPPVRHLPGLDIGRAYRGAEGEFRYGGDVVDVFHYNQGWTSLAVVDITGHGMAAARNAGLAKHALRGFVSLGLDARGCVRALNRLCIETAHSNATRSSLQRCSLPSYDLTDAAWSMSPRGMKPRI
jgi:serine phosphatase RsbU (regulator of sigma subunit)